MGRYLEAAKVVRAAMDAAGMDVSLPTVCELTRGVVLKLLRG